MARGCMEENTKTAVDTGQHFLGTRTLHRQQELAGKSSEKEEDGPKHSRRSLGRSNLRMCRNMPCQGSAQQVEYAARLWKGIRLTEYPKKIGKHGGGKWRRSASGKRTVKSRDGGSRQADACQSERLSESLKERSCTVLAARQTNSLPFAATHCSALQCYSTALCCIDARLALESGPISRIARWWTDTIRRHHAI